tara:strand:+ start:616 stop:1194 length:579 start_codon:yes stop_codon:yes gene_type:complete
VAEAKSSPDSTHDRYYNHNDNDTYNRITANKEKKREMEEAKHLASLESARHEQEHNLRVAKNLQQAQYQTSANNNAAKHSVLQQQLDQIAPSRFDDNDADVVVDDDDDDDNSLIDSDEDILDSSDDLGIQSGESDDEEEEDATLQKRAQQLEVISPTIIIYFYSNITHSLTHSHVSYHFSTSSRWQRCAATS